VQRNTHRRLYDAPQIRAARLEHGAEVRERLARLRLDAAFDERARFCVKAEATTREDEIANSDGMAVRPNCGWRICGVVSGQVRFDPRGRGAHSE
jgi:hypothetical protein